jgi:hypothetical protein
VSESADGIEGGINKNFFVTVGSMAYLKEPDKETIPKRLSNNYLIKSVALEDTQRLSFSLRNLLREENQFSAG